MSKFRSVSKDENNHIPVPIVWRQSFSDTVNAFQTGNFEAIEKIDDVNTLSGKDIDRIRH